MQDKHVEAYRPTSLDFINRPNPVEPNAGAHKHPLNHGVTPTVLDQGHLRRIQESNLGHGAPTSVPSASFGGDRPSKRQKFGDGPLLDLDLPKLPAVRQQGEQRLRIPPTLSGLHQPPPDAGILPSISVDAPRPSELPERSSFVASKRSESDIPKTSLSNQQPSSSKSSSKTNTVHRSRTSTTDGKPSKSRKNNKWSDQETNDLIRGVAKFGIGCWTKILNCEEYHFERRTALDLKDRFRVYCPEHYKTNRKSRSSRTSLGGNSSGASQEIRLVADGGKDARITERKTPAVTRETGFEGSFAKSSRRKRTGYTKAEDDAIWQGFQRHGKAWLTIQNDQSLCLGNRTSTDIRDRFRTNWPEEYEKAGLKTRVDGKPKSQQRREETSETQVKEPTASQKRAEPLVPPKLQQQNSTGASKEAVVPVPRRTDPTFLAQDDDVFWGLPFDAEEERITLDRRILDWPFDFTKSSAAPSAYPTNTGAINLPMPTSGPVGLGGPSTQHTVSAIGTLPSLAAVTGGSMPGEQLELPSLMTGFGTFEGEGGDVRTVAQLMSLDEVLS